MHRSRPTPPPSSFPPAAPENPKGYCSATPIFSRMWIKPSRSRTSPKPTPCAPRCPSSTPSATSDSSGGRCSKASAWPATPTRFRPAAYSASFARKNSRRFSSRRPYCKAICARRRKKIWSTCETSSPAAKNCARNWPSTLTKNLDCGRWKDTDAPNWPPSPC